MKLDSEMRVVNVDRPWRERIDGELGEQWDWFRARWNDHGEVVRGPLEVKTTQLEKDPPFAMVGRADEDESIVVALGYEDTHLRFIRPVGDGPCGGSDSRWAGAVRADRGSHACGSTVL